MPKTKRDAQLEEIAFMQAQIETVESLLNLRSKETDPIGFRMFSQRHKNLKEDLANLEQALEPESNKKSDCTFLCFKSSGKWYTTGRGVLPNEFFKTFDKDRRRSIIFDANNGKYPGLSGEGSSHIWVIMPDEDHETGWPTMMFPFPEA